MFLPLIFYFSMGFSIKEVKRLLNAYKNDDDLYDECNGVRQDILRSIGFYDSYVTFQSRSNKRRRSAPNAAPNWVTSAKAFRDLKARDVVRALSWTWMRGLPQDRYNVTHARGIFVIRHLKLVVTYDPRRLLPEDFDKATKRQFNPAHNDFVRRFPSTYRHVTVYGNQVKTWDCEKRVLRFGMCCLQRLATTLATQPFGPTHIKCGAKDCRLSITGICRYYVRKTT